MVMNCGDCGFKIVSWGNVCWAPFAWNIMHVLYTRRWQTRWSTQAVQNQITANGLSTCSQHAHRWCLMEPQACRGSWSTTMEGHWIKHHPLVANVATRSSAFMGYCLSLSLCLSLSVRPSTSFLLLHLSRRLSAALSLGPSISLSLNLQLLLSISISMPLSSCGSPLLSAFHLPLFPCSYINLHLPSSVFLVSSFEAHLRAFAMKTENFNNKSAVYQNVQDTNLKRLLLIVFCSSLSFWQVACHVRGKCHFEGKDSWMTS